MSSSFGPGKTLGAIRFAMQLVLPLFSPAERTANLKPVVNPAIKPEAKPPSNPATNPRPASVNGDGVLRQTLVRGEPIPYLFKRRRRKSIGFTIDQRGLIISAPRWVTMSEVDEAVVEKSDWINRKLLEWEAFEERRASLDTAWENGGSIRYLGETVCLRVEATGEYEPWLDEQSGQWRLHLGLAPEAADPKNVQIIVESWCQSQAREILGQRLTHFSERLGQAPKRWHLSSARTQWGSCNADGVIRLNWRLIHLPTDLLDYVVAHEVAHLRELNHSASFWLVVGQLMPDYENARKSLSAMPEHLAL
ncbi:MAG: SprT family zinc-dependent metalloprotease [Burkholderiaceae bacterium]